MIKTKNKVNNNVLLIVLSLLLFVGSIFAFVNFKSKNNNIVHADSVSTSFNGSSVFVPLTPNFLQGSDTWSTKTWSGLTNFSGSNIWSDGSSYYFSDGSTQRVLDTSTSTWSTKTWSGLTNFSGFYIWSDGTNIYYSNYVSSSNKQQYVLNTSTSTWSTKTWSGTSAINGSNIWSDGSNVYYSISSSHLVLDTSTSTWSTKTWYGLTNFDGSNIWSDGINVYYSNGSTQYVLDTSTSTWSTKTWSGLTSFTGGNIWSDGSNFYYSYGSTQYVLDTSTSTWSVMVWQSLTSFTGVNIWFEGSNVYYSNGSTQYVLQIGGVVKSSANVFNSVYFDFIDNISYFSVYQHSVFYVPYNNGVLYSLSDKVCTSIDGDFLSSRSLPYNSSISHDMYIPYYFNGRYYYSRVGFYSTGLSNLNFVAVSFSGSKIYITETNTYQIFNTIQYRNSLNQTLSINFWYYSSGDNVVNFYSDTTLSLFDYLDNSLPGETYSDFLFVFNERIYYLNTDYLNSDNYNQGYSSGYSAGQQAGYNSGLTDGANNVSGVQYNAGYSAGYSVGVAESNNYSFLGLISAVIDAPIKAFTGLFNFNLLGVNLLNFITALFTLAVIITIVKKVV